MQNGIEPLLDAIAAGHDLTNADARRLSNHIGGLTGDVNRLESELDECAEHRQLHGQVAAAFQRMEQLERENATLRGRIADLERDGREWAARCQRAEMQAANSNHRTLQHIPVLMGQLGEG